LSVHHEISQQGWTGWTGWGIFDFRFLIGDLWAAAFKSEIKNRKSKILYVLSILV
jgi:hypothetical protein